jgi:hypothetical protein
MKSVYFASILALLAGCGKDDIRLHATWRSDRDATVAAAFQRDPRWTNASPEKIARFRDIYGHMTLTYSNGVAISVYRGQTSSFPYRVIRRGPDFVVIRTGRGAVDSDRDIHIQFVDGGAAYWCDSGLDPLVGGSTLEKFDRVVTSPIAR